MTNIGKPVRKKKKEEKKTQKKNTNKKKQPRGGGGGGGGGGLHVGRMARKEPRVQLAGIAVREDAKDGGGSYAASMNGSVQKTPRKTLLVRQEPRTR